jgi:arylsulfatase A-like enzyme
MSTRLDRNVQRVLDALDRLNLSARTLVVFTSDHGATFEVGNLGASAALDSNRPFRGQKRTLWEGGIRVPCAIRWPGRIPPGTRIETPMQMIDLYPTFLAAAGSSDSRRCLDGANVLNAWQGQEVIPDRTLFWEWRTEGFDQVAALAGPWKLVITRGGRPELYDVVQDPAERRDLAAGHPDRTKEMRQALEAWLQSEERRSDSANPPVRRPESR